MFITNQVITLNNRKAAEEDWRKLNAVQRELIWIYEEITGKQIELSPDGFNIIGGEAGVITAIVRDLYKEFMNIDNAAINRVNSVFPSFKMSLANLMIEGLAEKIKAAMDKSGLDPRRASVPQKEFDKIANIFGNPSSQAFGNQQFSSLIWAMSQVSGKTEAEVNKAIILHPDMTPTIATVLDQNPDIQSGLADLVDKNPEGMAMAMISVVANNPLLASAVIKKISGNPEMVQEVGMFLPQIATTIGLDAVKQEQVANFIAQQYEQGGLPQGEPQG